MRLDFGIAVEKADWNLLSNTDHVLVGPPDSSLCEMSWDFGIAVDCLVVAFDY